MSSSESEDDEQMALFREAADSDLINDKMFKEVGQKKDLNRPIKEKKTERYLKDNQTISDDLNIPESMQNFVYSKLSKTIEKNIEFITINPSDEFKSDSMNCSVKLLKGFDFIDENISHQTEPSINKKATKIKRRITDNVVNLPENIKIKESVINFQDISNETQLWKSRRKAKIFEYHNKKNVLYLREPTNEFTKIRNKNNWSEAKIAKKLTPKPR